MKASYGKFPPDVALRYADAATYRAYFLTHPVQGDPQVPEAAPPAPLTLVHSRERDVRKEAA